MGLLTLSVRRHQHELYRCSVVSLTILYWSSKFGGKKITWKSLLRRLNLDIWIDQCTNMMLYLFERTNVSSVPSSVFGRTCQIQGQGLRARLLKLLNIILVAHFSLFLYSLSHVCRPGGATSRGWVAAGSAAPVSWASTPAQRGCCRWIKFRSSFVYGHCFDLFCLIFLRWRLGLNESGVQAYLLTKSYHIL